MEAVTSITISHYQLQRTLARGGMSQIFLACDMQTQQQVAIKLVDCESLDHCRRFHDEVQALAQLQHEHILPVLDYGEYAQWYYLVTPYIEYGTLTTRLYQGPLTLHEADLMLGQLASAVQYAHDQGILHCDIKPANILLAGGQHIYLADFGLAQHIGACHEIAPTDLLIGTAEYMAPELADRPATVSSDIYALGILLYQMLTGHVPFFATTPVATFLKQIYEPVKPPTQLNPALPASVEQVILRALAKDPGDRFASAQSLIQAYRQALLIAEAGSIATEIASTTHLADSLTLPILRRPHPKQNATLTALVALLLSIMPLLAGLFPGYDQKPFQQEALPFANVANDVIQIAERARLHHVPPIAINHPSIKNPVRYRADEQR